MGDWYPKSPAGGNEAIGKACMVGGAGAVAMVLGVNESGGLGVSLALAVHPALSGQLITLVVGLIMVMFTPLLWGKTVDALC